MQNYAPVSSICGNKTFSDIINDEPIVTIRFKQGTVSLHFWIPWNFCRTNVDRLRSISFPLPISFLIALLDSVMKRMIFSFIEIIFLSHLVASRPVLPFFTHSRLPFFSESHHDFHSTLVGTRCCSSPLCKPCYWCLSLSFFLNYTSSFLSHNFIVIETNILPLNDVLDQFFRLGNINCNKNKHLLSLKSRFYCFASLFSFPSPDWMKGKVWEETTEKGDS